MPSEQVHSSRHKTLNQCLFNPLRPHDALKHHFTSLKTNLIFLQQRVLDKNSHGTGLPIQGNFL